MSGWRQGHAPAWVAFGSILLLQLKLVWGIWSFRDLTPGDTSSYYAMAGLFSEKLAVDILWSPLYTAFLGLFRLVFTDPYLATTFHRVAILLLVTTLTFAVARRVVSQPVAWAVAAWWAVLPIHSNALYEVHLFAVAPVLIAWLVAFRWPDSRGRGTCLAILGLATVLVRNELFLATTAFAIACIAFEVRDARRLRRDGAPYPARRRAAAYLLALLGAGASFAGFYARSVVKWPEAGLALEQKHTLNACQAYAFGWRQRHPEWTGDPWTGCGELMTAHFGQPYPAMTTMLRRAPRRVAEHVAWNVRLTPGGMQVLLFNVMSAPASPDYSDRNPRHPFLAWGATALLVILCLGGVRVARRTGERVFPEHLQSGWLGVGSVALTAFLIIPTQRPRPAYLFAVGIGIAILSARLLDLLLRRMALTRRHGFTKAVLAGMVIIPALAPSYYYIGRHHDTDRRLRRAVRRLTPFRDLLSRDGTVALAAGAGWELDGYTGAGAGPTHRALQLESACDAAGERDLRACVDSHGASLLYLDESWMKLVPSAGSTRSFLQRPDRFGWRRIAPASDSGERWLLLSRTASP